MSVKGVFRTFVLPCLAFLMLGQSAHGADDQFMVGYSCVEKEFFRLIPKSAPLPEEAQLDGRSLEIVADHVPRALKDVLISASAQAAIGERGVIDPASFFPKFVDAAGQQLRKQIRIEGCGTVRDMENVLYLVGVGKYFSHVLGRGGIYHWFDQHGGAYSYSAIFAAMVSLQLSGRTVDVSAWKSFYMQHDAALDGQVPR